MTNNTDVELDAILADDSKPITDLGASDQKSETTIPVETAAVDLAAEASARANERIRELIDENKSLKESFNLSNSTDLDKFTASIEDEPSRNLLKTYGNLLRDEIRKEYNPVVEDYNVTRFEKEFAMYGEKVPELAAHKEELRKTYLRNPAQSLKALVGDTLLDIQTSKVKPIERAAGIASRSAPEIADATTDDLYAFLESRPPIN